MKRTAIMIATLLTIVLTVGCTATEAYEPSEVKSETDSKSDDSDIEETAEMSKDVGILPTAEEPNANSTDSDSVKADGCPPLAAPEALDDLSEKQPEPAQEPVPTPITAEATSPVFDAGSVIANASAQIGGFMTRDNGAATGMGWFTFSFSVYDSMDKMSADLTAVMQQEHDLYGNTWFDIEYLGENNGWHTFKLYRA